MKVYMAVTADKYELPFAITNTVVELAKILGISQNAVSSRISKGTSGKTIGYKCLCIDIDEDDQDED